MAPPDFCGKYWKVVLILWVSTIANIPPLTSAATTDPPIATVEVTSPIVPTTPQPDIWLLCAPEEIRVEIPFGLLASDNDYKDLLLEGGNETDCGGTTGTSEREGNNGTVFVIIIRISTDRTACGTHFQETDDEHEYTNTITNRGNLNGPISRQYDVDIPIVCSYDRYAQVTLEWYHVENCIISRSLRKEGVYELIIVIYRDSGFLIPVFVFPLVVHVYEFVYLEVSIKTTHLDISIQSCKATLGADYDAPDSQSYDIITDWEVADDEEETEVTCPNMISITVIRIKIRAFRFVVIDADQDIYIHCDVYVCDRDVADSQCKEACNSNYTSQPPERRRRAAEYAPPPQPVHRVTSGPIRIVRDVQSSVVESDYHGDAQPWTSPLWGVAVLAMGAVVIILLAALVVTLRKLSGKRGAGKTDEEEVVGLIGN